MLWIWKKYPDCVRLWVKFLILNAVLGVTRRKNLRNFSLWCLTFTCCSENVYRSAIIPRSLPCPKKLSVVSLYLTLPTSTHSRFLIKYLAKTVNFDTGSLFLKVLVHVRIHFIKYAIFVMNGWGFLGARLRFSWCQVEIFIMPGRDFIMNGWDLHNYRSRFCWWQVEILLLLWLNAYPLAKVPRTCLLVEQDIYKKISKY